MSYYTMKSNVTPKDYVVVKHSIPNVNSVVMGVKFRGSYAVVEKDSKLYNRLKKLPMLKNTKDFPLSFLRKLPFITRPLDVKMIFGADVYAKFLVSEETDLKKQKEEESAETERLHLADPKKCKFRLDSGSLCKRSDVEDNRITEYCSLHILKDPKLKENGFKIPLAMTNKDREKIRTKAFNKLKSLRKEENNSVDLVKEED